MEKVKNLEKIVKRIIEPIDLGTFLKLKGFKVTDRDSVIELWENKELRIEISPQEEIKE